MCRPLLPCKQKSFKSLILHAKSLYVSNREYLIPTFGSVGHGQPSTMCSVCAFQSFSDTCVCHAFECHSLGLLSNMSHAPPEEKYDTCKPKNPKTPKPTCVPHPSNWGPLKPHTHRTGLGPMQGCHTPWAAFPVVERIDQPIARAVLL